MKSTKQHIIQQLKKQKLSIGILAADWLSFATILLRLQQHHLNILHFDIADGHFSPLFSVGTEAIKKFPNTFFKDVHLLAQNQQSLAKQSVENGANAVTLQVESNEDIVSTLQWLNCQYQDNVPILSGISFCPSSSLAQITPYIPLVDIIQILTLDPKTGEKADSVFILERIAQVNKLLGPLRHHKIISVDGSLTLTLAKQFANSNIDWLVSGRAILAYSEGRNLETTLTDWLNYDK